MPEPALFTPLCTDLLLGGQAVRFTATGGSMYPAIRDGETVLVTPVEPRDVRCGDVLLYDSTRGLTAHRVARAVREGEHGFFFLLRGDGAGAPDERVEQQRILGRVAHVERGRWRLDPASLKARVLSSAWRAIVALKQKIVGLVAGARLPLPQTERWQRNASQGGS